MENEEKKNYDTLVLSGGGIKGFHLLGAVQALIDMKVADNIKTYIGTSVGAFISYLLIIGYTPIEIVIYLHMNKWIEKLQSYDFRGVINGDGIVNFSALHEALEKFTIDKLGYYPTMGKLKEKLGKTLICVTYNMTTSTTEYIGPDNYPDLPCLVALRMSANIPLIFDRYKYMDNYYIDGGISDNFAIIKGEELGENVLGVCLEISEKNLKDEPKDGVISYFLRLLYIPIVQSTKYKIQISKKSTVIPIKTGDMMGVVEFNIKTKTRLDMFSCGYSSAKEYFVNK
jgi:predicted acylesterase/phospholipase RssA